MTRDLSQTLENAGTPGSTVCMPKSSYTKKDTKNSAAATDCHLNGKPHCKATEKITFTCTNLIAEHLSYDVDFNKQLAGQVKPYFQRVSIVSDDILKRFATCTWPEPKIVIVNGEDIDSLTHATMLAL